MERVFKDEHSRVDYDPRTRTYTLKWSRDGLLYQITYTSVLPVEHLVTVKTQEELEEHCYCVKGNIYFDHTRTAYPFELRRRKDRHSSWKGCATEFEAIMGSLHMAVAMMRTHFHAKRQSVFSMETLEESRRE